MAMRPDLRKEQEDKRKAQEYDPGNIGEDIARHSTELGKRIIRVVVPDYKKDEIQQGVKPQIALGQEGPNKNPSSVQTVLPKTPTEEGVAVTAAKENMQAARDGKVLTQEFYGNAADSAAGVRTGRVVTPEGQIEFKGQGRDSGRFGTVTDRLARMQEGQDYIRNVQGGLTTGAGGSGPDGTMTAQDFLDKAASVRQSRMGMRAARGERQVLGPSMAVVQAQQQREKLAGELSSAIGSIKDQINMGKLSSGRGARLISALGGAYNQALAGIGGGGEAGSQVIEPDISGGEQALTPDQQIKIMEEEGRNRRKVLEEGNMMEIDRRTREGAKLNTGTIIDKDGNEISVTQVPGTAQVVPSDIYNQAEILKRVGTDDQKKQWVQDNPQYANLLQ